MMNITSAAEAEAERRWPISAQANLNAGRWSDLTRRRAIFVSGAEWASGVTVSDEDREVLALLPVCDPCQRGESGGEHWDAGQSEGVTRLCACGKPLGHQAAPSVERVELAARAIWEARRTRWDQINDGRDPSHAWDEAPEGVRQRLREDACAALKTGSGAQAAPSVTTVDLDALPKGDNPEPWPWGDRHSVPTACCETHEAIDGHWLVEVHSHCTCGAGGPEGHEPGCGTAPLVDLSGLPGWGSLAAPSVSRERVESTAETLAGPVRDE